MGGGIALVAAAAGHPVTLIDKYPGAVGRAAEIHRETYRKLVEKGKISAEHSAQLLSRITYAEDLALLNTSSLVIEAVIEQLSVKQELFRSLESIVSPDCMLASNTSSLSITSIAGSCMQPGRFLGLHFFNPAPLMPLVEVIPGVQTSSSAVETAHATMTAWGKSAVVVKDTPGFIVNRVARPYYGESLRILEESWLGLPDGPVGMATIDWALKEYGGFRMGPFELMDLIGNDINYTVTETVWKQFYHDPRYRPSLLQRRMVEAGRLGRKTGTGYYEYAAGVITPAPDKDPDRAKKIVRRVLSMLINEAVDACYLRIATAKDIDTAMTKGVNYPKGLLQWCDELGAEVVLEELESLREMYNEERYRASVLLKQMAAEGRRFYS
jgi:3-hydroxybutyryl-CoA dehydrogenase